VRLPEAPRAEDGADPRGGGPPLRHRPRARVRALPRRPARLASPLRAQAHGPGPRGPRPEEPERHDLQRRAAQDPRRGAAGRPDQDRLVVPDRRGRARRDDARPAPGRRGRARVGPHRRAGGGGRRRLGADPAPGEASVGRGPARGLDLRGHARAGPRARRRLDPGRRHGLGGRGGGRGAGRRTRGGGGGVVVAAAAAALDPGLRDPARARAPPDGADVPRPLAPRRPRGRDQGPRDGAGGDRREEGGRPLPARGPGALAPRPPEHRGSSTSTRSRARTST